MLTTASLIPPNPLRDVITNAYRMDETACLNLLIPAALLPEEQLAHIKDTAKQLVIATREYKKKQNKIDQLLHQYNLSTEEGIALMSLAEALLRIPDKMTMDKFISDKISTVDWQSHINVQYPLFVNAATWSLIITGKIFSPAIDHQKNLLTTLKRAVSRVGIVMIRPFILQMMKTIGKQFVMGETIESALTRSLPFEEKGYQFSYDMLGEAARTAEEAKNYYTAYVEAIEAIGKTAKTNDPA